MLLSHSHCLPDFRSNLVCSRTYILRHVRAEDYILLDWCVIYQSSPSGPSVELTFHERGI